MIEIRNIVKIYGEKEAETRALSGVSFNISSGEFIAIMGPSGCGKSTLMHILGMLDRQTEGIYKFEGKDISGLKDEERAKIRNQKIGFVFQSFNLLPRTTVLENVHLPLVYSNLSTKKHLELVKEAIKSVGLEHRLNYFSNQLSGGEQQRVAVARALVNKPNLILADEPTGNLDSKSGQQIMEILQKLNQKGHTIILVTHEQYTAQMAKRIIKMLDGEIIKDEMVVNQHLAKDGLIK